MSAATAGPVVPAADAARPLPPPVWRTVRSLARTYAVVAAWFVAVVLVLWVGAVVVAMRFGPLGQSMVQFSRQGMTWFPFSIGVTVVAGYHAAHIAAGMTRRALGVGTLLTSVGNAVVLSAVIAGLFWVEGLLYAANGWQQAIIDEGWFPADAGDLLAILGWQTLVTTAAQVSGMLVAVVYQRTGPWWGTLLLPLTAGPIVGMWWIVARGVTAEWLTTGARVGLSVLLTAALAAAYLVLLRGLQLRTPRT